MSIIYWMNSHLPPIIFWINKEDCPGYKETLINQDLTDVAWSILLYSRMMHLQILYWICIRK